jgi:hypothetical protein
MTTATSGRARLWRKIEAGKEPKAMTNCIIFCLFAFLTGTGWLGAEPLTVRIQAPSREAERVLLNKLNEAGRASGLRFEAAARKAELEIVVDWTSNWGTMAPPQATVTVAGPSVPTFSVQRTAPFRKQWAMEACAEEIVRRLASSRTEKGGVR